MSREWKLFFFDLLEFCTRIHAYTEGMDREAFEASDLTFDAVVRNVELLGEAAKHIPPEVRAQMPAIPWPGLIGVRNVLIHGYFAINKDILWDLVQTKVPELLQQLEQYQARVERGEIH